MTENFRAQFRDEVSTVGRSMRLYKLTVFKMDAGRKTVDGAKSTTEPLPRACKKLVKLFGLVAPVRLIADRGRFRRYQVGDGLAELETLS